MIDNEYLKTILFKFKVQDKDVDDIIKDIQKKFDKVNLLGGSEQSKDLIKTQLAEVEGQKQLIKAIQEQIDVVKDLPFTKENMKVLKDLQKNLKEEQKKVKLSTGQWDDATNKIAYDWKVKMIKAAGDAAKKVGEFFKDTFMDAINETRRIAGFNMMTSSAYSGEAWGMLKEYGVTGSQAYALQKAMEDIGVGSYDELVEALLEPKTADRFGERLGYWTENYSKAQEAGKAMNDFILEWKDFKNDLMMDFVNWFGENKEEIKTMITFSITVLKGLAQVIGGIIKFFARNQESTIASASDVVRNYSTVSTTNNNNIGITVNGTNSTAIGQNVYGYLQTKLGIR